ncbi:MAG: TlpA family protein disulfide reductase [Flavobacteriales bacterium]|nr:TlpA family protein disulfide reductase [Flavobacteriales bacterium]
MTFPRISFKGSLIACLFTMPGLAHAQAYYYPNGSTVADFTVTDVEGTAHTLSEYTAQGKYVMLDFFTLWCEPCQETAPYWAELYQTYGCNSADLICLSLDFEANSAAEVQAYSATYCGSWAHPPVVTNAAALAAVFGVGNAPNYCLIGPDNVMINNFIWPVASMAELAAALPGGGIVDPQACGVGMAEQGAPVMATHPNPTHGILQLGRTDVVRVALHDASGRQCAAMPVLAGRLDLQGIGPGLYLLHQFNERGVSVGSSRVVVE